jgi:hypothetical protein
MRSTTSFYFRCIDVVYSYLKFLLMIQRTDEETYLYQCSRAITPAKQATKLLPPFFHF